MSAIGNIPDSSKIPNSPMPMAKNPPVTTQDKMNQIGKKNLLDNANSPVSQPNNSTQFSVTNQKETPDSNKTMQVGVPTLLPDHESSKNTEQLIDQVVGEIWMHVGENASKYTAEHWEMIRNEVEKFAASDSAHSFNLLDHTIVLVKTVPGEANEGTGIWKSNTTHFARGAAGRVFDGEYIGNLGKMRRDVMKVPTRMEDGFGYSAEHVQHARDSLRNEVTILKEIHKDGKKSGVAPTPHTVLWGEEMGFLVDWQTMNGKELGSSEGVSRRHGLVMDKADKVISQVSSGLDAVHDAGVYHGDIKSENLLWSDDKRELMISDFGGARKFSELVPLDHFPTVSAIFGDRTPSNVSHDIYFEILHLLDEKKIAYGKETDSLKKENLIKDMLEKDIKPLLIKNDKFALGLSLIESVGGSFELLEFSHSQGMPFFIGSEHNQTALGEHLLFIADPKQKAFRWEEKTKNTVLSLLNEGDLSKQGKLQPNLQERFKQAIQDTEPLERKTMDNNYLINMNKLAIDTHKHVNALMKPENREAREAERTELINSIKDFQKTNQTALGKHVTSFRDNTPEENYRLEMVSVTNKILNSAINHLSNP